MGEEEGEEEEEGEDAMEGSDEEDDTAERMAACGEVPRQPPEGFAYAACLPLVSLDDKKTLVARKVLTGHLEDGACGWFVGTVVSSAVGARDKKKTPTATHIVDYKEKETRSKQLVGREATELSTEKYGAAEWWLLLEPLG